MGRRAQPEIRERLLAACTDHVLAHGLPGRLAPLATAAGTSSRMLLYHFGTRDQLLREVLVAARQRQVSAWGDLLRGRPGEDYRTSLRAAWHAVSGPEGQAFLRLFNPLHGAAGEPLWPGFRRVATTDWLAPLEDGLAALGRPELATLVLAVMRGLLMDLDATGDTTRAAAAFDAFVALLAPAA